MQDASSCPDTNKRPEGSTQQAATAEPLLPPYWTIFTQPLALMSQNLTVLSAPPETNIAPPQLNMDRTCPECPAREVTKDIVEQSVKWILQSPAPPEANKVEPESSKNIQSLTVPSWTVISDSLEAKLLVIESYFKTLTTLSLEPVAIKSPLVLHAKQ